MGDVEKLDEARLSVMIAKDAAMMLWLVYVLPMLVLCVKG